MQIIADLQIHSKFSRAVSPEMELPQIGAWARRKGIALMATGDWTHPLWMREIKRDLEEAGNGLLKLKDDRALRVDVGDRGSKMEKNLSSIIDFQHRSSIHYSPYFLLATEVSCIFTQGGKGRRVHTLVWVPTFASADKISREMTHQGCNLLSDGRPIIGLTSIQVAELVLTIEPKALIIPAHAWTPWFSIYGSMSGFNSIDEAFGPYAKNIYAVETGLSSSPSMNWRIKELDNRSILSFSDAHSGPKIGREATVFEMPEGGLSYESIYQAIRGNQANDESGIMNNGKEKAKNHNSKFIIHDSRIAYTIEFYPEEGKYHWSGHRACNIRWGPKDTEKNGTACPVCGKPLTQGVEQRVGELAGRTEEDLKLTNLQINVTENTKVRMVGSKAFPKRPPYVSLVPLQEILAECIGSPVASPKVQTPYRQLTDELNGEFKVLLEATRAEISKIAGERVAAGIEKVRSGNIHIDPGYDGVFGVVKIWREGEQKPLIDASKEQLSIF